MSTAVERVCWLLCVAEVRVALLCFIYSSLLALLWVCKRCSSKVLPLSWCLYLKVSDLHMDRGTQLEKFSKICAREKFARS